MSFVNVLYTVILYPLVQVIEIAFNLFDKLFDNTGIAIIGVSVTVTLLCLPLYIVAEHWQQVQRDTEKKLKPNTDRIKSVFKGDEQYMILSAFYKENHYHPIMALRSSFGLLIQIPFFMAAYSCLSKMPALQGQSFLFIRDMGKQDALFMIGSFPVNILPIAMTMINIIAGAIYTKGFPVKEKVQIYGMALIFLALLYTSPSGLVLYWTMNNVFSLVKNIFYKMKNPLKVLYYCMCACIVAVDVYILFIYSGGASTKKRLSAAIPLTCLILIPLFIKGINYLLSKPLSSIISNNKIRFELFIFSALGLCILTGIVIPSTIISSSVQEFSNVGSIANPSLFILHSFWQSFGLFIVWPLCIYFLFHEKIKTLMGVLFSIGLFCGIVNTYAFPGNYGTMDITLKFIGEMNNPSKIYLLVDLIAIVAVIAVLFVLFHFKLAKIISSVSLISAIAFTCLGFVNIHKINSEYKDFQKISANKDDSDTFKKQFHFSKTGKNVVLIMLDRSESSYFEDIVKDFPELSKTYEGFTFYRNALSCNGHTLMGAPGLYGGYEYIPSEMNKRHEQTLKSKHNEALMLLPKLFTEQADFYATLTDLSWGNYSYISDMRFAQGIENIDAKTLKGHYTGDFKKEFLNDTSASALQDSVSRNLLWIGFFREFPAILRPIVYYKGTWWDSATVTDLDDFIDWFGELYYLPKITDCESHKSNLLIMTNETTHCNEDIKSLNLFDSKKLSYPTSAAYDVNAISIIIIGKWLDYLKENNVYDNTRIIIVADHGMGYGKCSDKDYDDPLIDGFNKDHLNPLMLYKDFSSKGDLKKDLTFMTNADTPTLLLNDIIENPINPFTHNPVNSDYKKNGVSVTIDDLFMPFYSKSDKIFTVKEDSWYTVKDNIFVSSNWSKGKN